MFNYKLHFYNYENLVNQTNTQNLGRFPYNGGLSNNSSGSIKSLDTYPEIFSNIHFSETSF